MTCFSKLSRNRAFGERLGRGEKLDHILATTRTVVEGYPTARSALQVARRAGVETPIIDQVYLMLYEGKDIARAIHDLIARDSKPERAPRFARLHPFMNIARIQVPATTSNLGPGFDTLGIALSLRNEITVARSDRRGVRVVSPISEDARPGAAPCWPRRPALFPSRPPTLVWHRRVNCRRGAHRPRARLQRDRPARRDRGPERASTGAGWDRQFLLNLVTSLEHHPDNAAPAIFGGFTAAGMLGPVVRCFRKPVSDRLSFVTLIPRFEVSTEKARKLVPASFSKADTIHNLNRAALITAAFVSEDYGALPGLFEDKVHQPYRQRLIPALSKVIRAGEKAGALGGWLSGSGLDHHLPDLGKRRRRGPDHATRLARFRRQNPPSRQRGIHRVASSWRLALPCRMSTPA